MPDERKISPEKSGASNMPEHSAFTTEDTTTASPLPTDDRQLHSITDRLGEVRVMPVRLSRSGPVLPFDGIDARASEQYRMLRTKILQHAKKPRMIVVSSAGPSDGKTVTVINLAGAMALCTGARILILDADLRRSTMSEKLGLPPAPGLTAVLEARCTLAEAIVHIQQIPNLFVLPAGIPGSNPSELIDSPAWIELCRQCRDAFTYVIVDSPPVAAVADYQIIQSCCDGVIVVARPDHTNRKQCLRVLDLVPKEGLLGVVLNCTRKWMLSTDPDYGYHNPRVLESAAVAQPLRPGGP
jgi:capsular exopolysaccharide synthesis family protein